MSEKIKQEALNIGFSACGIAPARHLKNDEKKIRKWLDNNRHADMKYMENHFEKRVDASKIVDNAKSVISVLVNYFPEKTQYDKTAPVFSKYSYGKDYHYVMKPMMKKLLENINNKIKRTKGRYFVDSAPVLDRANAYYAGLGWIGKNTCLINKNLGSFVFIGEIIVDLELEYDSSQTNYCGNCTKCIDACPTGALCDAGVLDSRKCISYLTIENKKELPSELKEKFKNRVFGCDICQDVCPWNKNLKPHNIEELTPSEQFLRMTKQDWINLDKRKFDILFENSAVKRTKFDGLIRNIKFITD